VARQHFLGQGRQGQEEIFGLANLSKSTLLLQWVMRTLVYFCVTAGIDTSNFLLAYASYAAF